MRAATVRKGVRVRSRATPSSPSAEVGVSARSLFLSAFSHRGTKRSGVSVRVEKTKGRTRLRRAFLLRFRSGRRAIAEPPSRPADAPTLSTGRKGNVLLFGMSLATLLRRPEKLRELHGSVRARLDKAIVRRARLEWRRRLGLSSTRRRRRR